MRLGNSDASNAVIGPPAPRPWLSASQKASLPIPLGATTPMPVIATRRALFDNRYGPGPAGAGSLDLHWKARDGKAGWCRQVAQVRQLLDLTVLALAAHQMRGPQMRGIPGLQVIASHIQWRSIQSPGVGADNFDSLIQ